MQLPQKKDCLSIRLNSSLSPITRTHTHNIQLHTHTLVFSRLFAQVCASRIHPAAASGRRLLRAFLFLSFFKKKIPRYLHLEFILRKPSGRRLLRAQARVLAARYEDEDMCVVLCVYTSLYTILVYIDTVYIV